jgi:hypothetical protein
MNTCKQIRRDFQRDLTGPQAAEVTRHLDACGACAREIRLVRLERALLEATVPDEAGLTLSPGFLMRLRARRRAAGPGEQWTFWDLVWSFSRPVAAVAVILLLFISGLNLYTSLKRENEPLLMESYLSESSSDEISLILFEDAASTQERVLQMVAKEDDNGNQR